VILIHSDAILGLLLIGIAAQKQVLYIYRAGPLTILMLLHNAVVESQDLGPSKSGFGLSGTALLPYLITCSTSIRMDVKRGTRIIHNRLDYILLNKEGSKGWILNSARASSRSAEDAVHVAKVAMIAYVKQRISHQKNDDTD
jgi:hypothetical protein